jgi:hypothetical protein
LPAFSAGPGDSLAAGASCVAPLALLLAEFDRLGAPELAGDALEEPPTKSINL